MKGRLAASCLLGLIALALATTSQADGPTGLPATTPAERADYQTGLLTDMLALTPDQVPKVGAVNLEYAKQIDPILKGDQSRYTRYKEATAILAAKDEAMKPLLSAAQYEKYLDGKKTVQNDLEKHFAGAGETTP